MLPAPCRRHAAGRVDADVPSHLQPAARLQMSWHGRHACWLWPCGHCSRRLQGEGRVWHQCLTIQRAAAKLFAKAASELVSMVCRRVWRLSASLHRYRARTRLWCNGDCMAKRRRVTAKPLVPNMGTSPLNPFAVRLYVLRLRGFDSTRRRLGDNIVPPNWRHRQELRGYGFRATPTPRKTAELTHS